jgi:(p)ppGpp synthase/HD superfamily hydrolase
MESARNFAIRAHGLQKYGDRPYVFHLDQVSDVLGRFNHTEQDLAQGLEDAAYLHDTIEDTATNYADIVKGFGVLCAELVYAVTDELGRNREERHEKTYPKIAAYPQAITLKLADRIANVEHSLRMGDHRKFHMYSLEHPNFINTLSPYGGPRDMWTHLSGLFCKSPFKAPENCGFYDQDGACLGCGNRRPSSNPYCLLSPEIK